jgi:hypothetical protein
VQARGFSGMIRLVGAFLSSTSFIDHVIDNITTLLHSM